METQKKLPGEAGNDFDMGLYLKEGFRLVKENPVPFILGNLVLMVINGVAMGLLVGHWYAGMYYMVKKARKGETLEFGDAFWGFNNFIPIFIAGLVFSVGVGFGSMLCLIPGLIVGAILFYLVPLVAFNEMEISDAINRTKDEAMKCLVPHILFFFIVGVISACGAILCGVGVFLTVPVGVAAMAVAYEERIG